MTRSEAKPKSIRKALRDVSNNNGGGRSSRSAAVATKKCPVRDKETRSLAEQGDGEGDGSKALDRLMVVHSDLTVLIRQVTTLTLHRNCNPKRTHTHSLSLSVFGVIELKFTLLCVTV